MVKVVPTEEGAEVSLSQGTEIQPSNDVTSEQQPQSDDPAEGQPTIPTIAGASAEEEDQCLSGVSDDASSPKTEDMHHQAKKLDPAALGSVDAGSLGTDSNTKGSSLTLDMGKHSGMTTFSLMRHDDESSLDKPDAGVSAHTEQDGDEENAAAETLMEAAEEKDEDEESDLEGHRLVRQNTGVTRKFVRQNTGVGGGGELTLGKKKKKAPFRVPQTMYMGHPVGSPAAEFLERQQHRLTEVKTRRKKVAGLVNLVMEHNPTSTGSVLPDIDAVFPDHRGREKSQGDFCV